MSDRVAAVTMVWNEPHYLPVWLAHYARQVGAANCFVIDHGSDDGSTEGLGAVNVVRLPRSPHDDTRRTRFLSQFCASLLNWYDAVAHSDVDELLVADPAAFGSLAHYASSTPCEVTTAIGLDVMHLPDEEPEIEPTHKVLGQRGWVRFASSMCKPALIRRAVEWAPGFHCAAGEAVCFDRLYLFHLRYWDEALGLARLRKTRAMAIASPDAVPHQRVADEDWSGLLRAVASLPRRAGVALDTGAPPLSGWLGRVLDSRVGREGETYTIDLHLSGDELWAVPERFRGCF